MTPIARPYAIVIFDRDATLNRTTRILRPGQQPGQPTDGYVLTPDELVLLPHAAAALGLLRQHGIRPFVFTQQNCIGKGLVTTEDIAAIHDHMNALLGPTASIEAFYVASDRPGQPDPRGKPSPAMIHEIVQHTATRPQDVLVIGDSPRDMAAARAAGVDFAWVRDDLGRTAEADMVASGYPVFDDVLAAVTACVLLLRTKTA